MRTPLFMSLLLATCVAQAMPVDLSGATYTVKTFAELGFEFDGVNSDSSPPTSLSIASASNVTGRDAADGEFATADAIADDGFLAIDTEVTGLTQPAVAVAKATFGTVLSGAGTYTLRLDFETANDLAGGYTQAVLGFSLSVGGTTLFNEVFSSSGQIERMFELGAGEEGLLDISLGGAAVGLVSDPSATVGAYAFNLSSVGIEIDVAPVPAPSAWTLMLTGLLPLLGHARRRAARAASADPA